MAGSMALHSADSMVYPSDSMTAALLDCRSVDLMVFPMAVCLGVLMADSTASMMAS